MKNFRIGAQTYHINEVMNGQTALQYSDPLASIALQPDLREGTVLTYNSTGLEGLVAQIQRMVNGDKRTVKTNPYYSTEYNKDITLATVVKRAGAAGTAGQNVTVTVARQSHSANGKYAIPVEGHRGYIKELRGQGVDIGTVTETLNAHTVVLKPLNNESLDLTKLQTYTILIDPMRMYVKGTLDCIIKESFVQQPPLLHRNYLQMFEKGYHIHQDELTGYAYNVDFKLYKGIDPFTGKGIVNWGIPELTKQILADVMDSRNINTMFGLRDDINERGFDGLIPTADKLGMFSRRYDPADGVSLKTHFFNMIKGLRKVQGCMDYLLAYDFGFRMDWSEAIAKLVKDSNSTYTYKLFGEGGEGIRDFKYFEFADFEAFGYHFRGYQVDAFDAERYGEFLSNFAYVSPLCKFKDTNGKTVSPITYVNIGAAEMAPESKIWADDTRKRGCRTVDVYAVDTYGMEQHGAQKTGTFRRTAVN